MQSLLNKGSRLMTQSLRAGARCMSSASEQEAKEQMHRWTTISKGMIGLVAVYTVYAIGDHLSHEHHEEETPAYPYLKMRTKPFPWPESDCDLLDRECRRKAREAKKALDAPTGTGKTASYLIPAIAQVLLAREEEEEVLALVLAPVRELAIQIETVAKLLMRGIADMKTALLVGGFPVPTQRYRLQGGVQLIVATPGRFLDIFTNYSGGDAILPAIRLCVVDEVDIMLDVGFRPQITQIVALLAGERHKGIQLLFFSATVSDEVEALVRQVLKAQSDHSYTRIDVRSDENKGTSGYSLSPRVKHEVRWAENKVKKNGLFEFLKGKGEESTLVFVGSKVGATMLAETIEKRCRIGAAAIHADKTQQERLSLLESFVSLEIPVLVSTNVLSRGMDLLNVENVVVYDFPKKIADFVHLIGRTGRADDAPGKALTLVNLDDRLLFKELVTLLRQVKVSIPPEVFQSIHSEDAKKRARSIEVVVDESKRAFRIREQLMDEIGTQASDWKEWDSHNKRRHSTTDDREFGIGGDSETPDQTWTPQRKSSDPTEVKRHDTNHYCVAPHNSLEDDSILQSSVPNEEDAVHNYQVRQEQQSHHERCEAYTKSQLISYDGSESVQCERP
ncbi:hypothetical protein JG687_00007154 [Phytophthora cactorum]|uniref:P-loop containing nucleoside triphosphate hydrolase n=1 Tax=Phytophthora cactorum TaxID=29920 RepID=A0A8T1UFY8_9STRA|nr:hypothetical protein JG687_00007154 [Phytophthora cactorum]